MPVQKRIRLNEGHKGESQAASVRRSNEELVQWYLDLPTKERDTRFADVSRVAQLTGISPRTIQRWAKQRRICAILIAERYQIEIDSLYNYIKQRAWTRGD
jgi:hypothetical protein